jgi:hypothetical protein
VPVNLSMYSIPLIIWAISDAAQTADGLIAGWPATAIEAAQRRHREELVDYQAARREIYAGERRFPDDPYWSSRLPGT